MTAIYILRAFQVPSPGAAPALLASSLRDLSPKAFVAIATGEHACICVDHMPKHQRLRAQRSPCTRQLGLQPGSSSIWRDLCTFVSAITRHHESAVWLKHYGSCLQTLRDSIAAAAAGLATTSRASSWRHVLETRTHSRN